MSLLNRTTSLNPNAAEFVPFSLRGPATASSSSIVDVSAASGKRVLDRSDSNNSDDQVGHFWHHHLPDDITPDFKVTSEEDESRSLSLAGLSLHGEVTSTGTGTGTGGYLFNETLGGLVNRRMNDVGFVDETGCPISDDSSSATYLFRNEKSWDMQLPATRHHSDKVAPTDVAYFEGSMRRGYPTDLGGESSVIENTDTNPLQLLISQFPGFAAESLAEVYYANGCHLNSTIDMLMQLELQVDGTFDQNMNPKTLSAPNLSSMDFPSLPVPDNKTSMPKFAGDELQQSVNPYQSSEKENLLMFKSGSSLTGKGASDFATAVRKLASQDSGLWKYDRNGSGDATVGSSKSSHILSGPYVTGTGRNAYVDRMPSRASSRAAPVWLETGDAVANLYSELREEARDHARIRNTYFEQARQAYMIGNKALAKELGMKGQLHNEQMKAAHEKAQESIYRQRNPISPDRQGGGRSHERMIDLHGLHVSEAIHVLRHELGLLRNAARLAEQRLLVYICVGTGHHTRGSRTPARLPISVQRYLLEEEGLQFTEPQPGMLRVVLY